MSDTFRVGVIAGVAQVTAAFIALFGTLVTAALADASGGGGGSSGTGCTAVYERYRNLVLLDGDALDVLTTPGPDGLSPVEADADARRCGLSEAALRAMR